MRFNEIYLISYYSYSENDYISDKHFTISLLSTDFEYYIANLSFTFDQKKKSRKYIFKKSRRCLPINNLEEDTQHHVILGCMSILIFCYARYLAVGYGSDPKKKFHAYLETERRLFLEEQTGRQHTLLELYLKNLLLINNS